MVLSTSLLLHNLLFSYVCLSHFIEIFNCVTEEQDSKVSFHQGKKKLLLKKKKKTKGIRGFLISTFLTIHSYLRVKKKNYILYVETKFRQNLKGFKKTQG